ncbi:hypothetical protein CVAR21S_02077 [Corynebacterium variabile]
MHHHTFVHRRPAHVIDLFGNLLNPSPPTPSWSLVTNPDPTAQAKLRTNRNEYALATSCAPDPDDNVYRTADHLARTLGITHLEAVDTEIAELLTPTRPHQAVPGPRTLRRQTTAILTTHQPDARPADPEDPELPTPDLSPDFTIDTTDTDYTVFQITLPTDEAIGATRIIDAIATAHNTSRATAFTELLHGTAGEVKVTLNCHRNLDTGDMHLENHKLTGIAPGTWMRRVTDLTVPSHSTHHGRFATEAQKALIAGIDGTCRAPGCDNPAATADADHIHRYDNNPHTGTREMQSLCRRCHILKTLGLTDYTRLTDGTTIVSSIDDNHTVTTVPTGPLAHANLTFDRRLARKTSTRKEHQNLRDTWNYITRFAFQNVGASAIIVEEAPTPSS